MKVVYVAGPFRARPDPHNQWGQWQNIMRAAALAQRVWAMGAACLCPHLNTAFFQASAPDEAFLDGDIEMLNRCDAVLMTPDWKQSSGATAEHQHAVVRGLPVFYTIDELETWLGVGG